MYYYVSVAGSTNLNGITDWQIGDLAVFNGTVWQKIDNTDAVQSVNGQTGIVVLDANSVGATANTTYVLSSGLLTGGARFIQKLLFLYRDGGRSWSDEMEKGAIV